MDKTKEKVAHTPAVGVAGEQPSYMYNNTIIADMKLFLILFTEEKMQLCQMEKRH